MAGTGRQVARCRPRGRSRADRTYHRATIARTHFSSSCHKTRVMIRRIPSERRASWTETCLPRSLPPWSSAGWRCGHRGPRAQARPAAPATSRYSIPRTSPPRSTTRTSPSRSAGRWSIAGSRTGKPKRTRSRSPAKRRRSPRGSPPAWSPTSPRPLTEPCSRGHPTGTPRTTRATSGTWARTRPHSPGAARSIRPAHGKPASTTPSPASSWRRTRRSPTPTGRNSWPGRPRTPPGS